MSPERRLVVGFGCGNCVRCPFFRAMQADYKFRTPPELEWWISPMQHNIHVERIRIHLQRDDVVLHENVGFETGPDQWQNLRQILNQVTGQGYLIPEGTLIISGALGQVHSGVKGHYTAHFGELGRIEFELKE